MLLGSNRVLALPAMLLALALAVPGAPLRPTSAHAQEGEGEGEGEEGEDASVDDEAAKELARKLLALRRGGNERSELLELARRELRALVEDQRWKPLEEIRGAEDPLSDDALSRLLEQSSVAALNALLSQREATGGEP